MGNKASSNKDESKFRKGKNNDIGDEFVIDGDDNNKSEFESATYHHRLKILAQKMRKRKRINSACYIWWKCVR